MTGNVNYQLLSAREMLLTLLMLQIFPVGIGAMSVLAPDLDGDFPTAYTVGWLLQSVVIVVLCVLGLIWYA